MSEREELANSLADWMENEPYSKPPFDEIWKAVEFLRQPPAPVQVTDAQVDAALAVWIGPDYAELPARTLLRCRSGMHVALEAALHAGMPSGWKLVPEEPTPEMLARGTKAADEKLAAWRGYDPNGTGLDGMNFCVREAFKAMLAAAPAPGEGR